MITLSLKYTVSPLLSVSLPSSLSSIGEKAFADCCWLDTVLLPNRRAWIGVGTFAGCTALEVLVVPDGLLFSGRKRERWRVPARAQMIYHSELEISLLFAELASSDTPEDRKTELRQEIRQRLRQLRRRSAAPHPAPDGPPQVPDAADASPDAANASPDAAEDSREAPGAAEEGTAKAAPAPQELPQAESRGAERRQED